MAGKGSRPGERRGGRKKGTPNRRTAALKTAEQTLAAGVNDARAGGLEPLDYLLSIMRDPTADPHLRLVAARASAPYRHPALQAVRVQQVGADGAPLRPVINLMINAPVASLEPPRSKLTVTGPKQDDTLR
jgi:hypothetical protein